MLMSASIVEDKLEVKCDEVKKNGGRKNYDQG